MLNLYFNPYPKSFPNAEDAIQNVTQTITSLKAIISSPKDFHFFHGEGLDSINNWIASSDESGALNTIKSLLPTKPSKERTSFLFFLQKVSKATSIPIEDIEECEDWELEHLPELPVTILEIASKRDALSITFSKDSDWCRDIYNFTNPRNNKLPNIHGQSDLSAIKQWDEERRDRCSSFLEKLCDIASAFPCAEITREITNLVNPKLVLDKFQLAKNRDYICDGDLLKYVEPHQKKCLELRILASGDRMFFKRYENTIFIGGFYNKNQGISQQSAINTAIKRIGKEIKAYSCN